MFKNTRNIFITLTLFVISLFGQTPDEVLADGKNELNNGQFVRAESLFTQALNMDPTFAPAMLELARINLRLGKMKETRDFLKGAIDADPENQEFRDEFDRINEINTLMNDAGRYMGNADYTNAFESYRIVLEKFPIYAEAAYSMGVAKFRGKNLDEAVQHFKKSLKINPYHEKARTELDNVTKKTFNDGMRAYKRGDLDGALNAYNRVLVFDQNFYHAHFQLGVIDAKMGNRDLAIDHYQIALDINPNFYKGWYAMGISKKAKSDNEGALAAFKTAVEVNPEYDKAYGAMGTIYLSEKKYDEAIEVLNTAVQVNSKYSKGYSTLGVVYSEMEDWANAANNLVFATTYNEKDAMAWYRLAAAYNKLDECDLAEQAARKSTDRKPAFGGGWIELGVATWCEGKGNKVASVNALEKARKDRTWRKIAEYEMDKIVNPQKYQN